MEESAYSDEYVKALFDRMGPTYDAVNLISSLGFSALWRKQCVRNARVRPGDRVCDMMAGSGECWSYVPSGASVASIDFCAEMVSRQKKRIPHLRIPVEVFAENALETSLPSGSVDCVISAFGLKTLNSASTAAFAREVHRVLRAGGRYSVLEISDAKGWMLAPVFRWYVGSIIPWIGKVCLGDIECYRMLGRYTEAFGSCRRASDAFLEAGLTVSFESHFYGCATSLVGSKP